MKSIIITYRNKKYRLTALTSAGMGQLSGYIMYGWTDAHIYRIAKEYPQSIRTEKLS